MWGGVQPYNLMIHPDEPFILVSFVRDDFATLKQVIISVFAELINVCWSLVQCDKRHSC